MQRDYHESFVIGDKRSVKRLSRDRTGEENSGRAYYLFVLEYLRSHGGVVERAELRKALLQHYSGTFGPSDRKVIRSGRGKVPKWQNTLAWAMVLGRRQEGEMRCLSRSKTEQRVRKTFIVLMDEDITPKPWMEWVTGKKIDRHFVKRCKRCRRKNPLGARLCFKCKTLFPLPSKRIHRLPRRGS